MNKQNIEGKIVSKEYVAQELGFKSPEQMDQFDALVHNICPKVKESLKRWFGSENDQIVFEITNICVMEFLSPQPLTTKEKLSL